MMSDQSTHPYRSRPFAGMSDLRRMLDLCGAAHRDLAHGEYYHSGDVLWQMFRADGFDAGTLRLWEDAEGALRGFAWFDASRVTFQVHPATRGDARLEDAILAWLEEETCRTTAGASAPVIETDAFDDDAQRIAVLARRGYLRAENGYISIRFEQSLADLIPASVVPPGVTVRQIADETEFAERVALHRDVWAKSRVTVDSYRRMRDVAGYLPELDIVAVAPDGALASYCICWFDPASRTGQFEPVGTRAAYRGHGYGTIVVREGLRRLQSCGARIAIVHTPDFNTAAVRLYFAAGFRIVSRDHTYTKKCGT